uniref:Uncharacterized protein n=1 Tax=Toxoplasma gondii COUG TaxID=1074873 RepID=A0A2G8XW36_TOXGO|nr:hypothetical protein TGCOUG_214800 [Toxoplasma gondii COUG]
MARKQKGEKFAEPPGTASRSGDVEENAPMNGKESSPWTGGEPVGGKPIPPSSRLSCEASQCDSRVLSGNFQHGPPAKALQSAGGTSRVVKKRKTDRSSQSGSASPKESSRQEKKAVGSRCSAATTPPSLPSWAQREREALETLTDEFYARHRLYLRVWPVTACQEEGESSRGKKKGDEDEASKLRQEQLMNMRVMLHDRVAENLSFTCTQYNSPLQPPRNRCLPSFLKPRGYRACRLACTDEVNLSVTTTGTSEDPECDNPREGDGGAPHGEETAEELLEEATEGTAEGEGIRRKGSVGEAESIEASGEDKINELQKSLLADGFTGCWILLLSEKYIPPAEEPHLPPPQGQEPQRPAESPARSRAGRPSADHGDASVSGGGHSNGSGDTQKPGGLEASPTPRVRRVIVCGALVEVYSNNERQISALWCLPCLSAQSTRLLLQAFLPRLVVEALKLPDVLPPPSAAEPKKKKRAKGPGKGGDNAGSESDLESVAASLGGAENDGEEGPPAPMKSVFAVCEDTLLWPRQALFLLASPTKMDFLRHVEPLQPQALVPPGPDEEAQPQLHVDAGLGPQWRDCNCRRRFHAEAQRPKPQSMEPGKPASSWGAKHTTQSPNFPTTTQAPDTFLRFFSVSELWAARLMPPKEARARLEAAETRGPEEPNDAPETRTEPEATPGAVAKSAKHLKTKEEQRHASVWPLFSDGWASLVPKETCDQLVEEIYGGMPYLRQYFDEDPQETNVARDEMCGLTEDECRTILQW